MTFTATLHTGDPGRTGEHMVFGLFASTRMEVTDAGAGFITTTAQARFERVPPDLRPTHLGFWRGPVFIGSAPIDSPDIPWTANDILTITAYHRFTFEAWLES